MPAAIAEAAAEAFVLHGFSRTSTRQIADGAGVAEALVFRHFGTKASLFDLAVRQRFAAAVWAFEVRVASELAPYRGPGDHSGRRLLEMLCAFVIEHREAIVVLMTVDAFEPGAEDVTAATRAVVGRLVRLVDEHVLTDAEGAPRPALDPGLSAPAVLALVLGALVLDQTVYADVESLPSPASRIDEVVAMILYGVSHRGHRTRRPPTSS